METIKIAHLYYDIMNLYGENGNIRFLKKKLEEQNLNVEIHFLSLEDEINYNNYDIFYLGTGSEENKKIVIKDMLNKKQSIIEAIHNNKYFIITGNALGIFGKGIKYLNEDYIKCLNIFNYEEKEEEFRIVGEQFYNYDNNKIIGFQNRNVTTTEYTSPLFTVEKGTGCNPNSKTEGVHEHNFFGTYLLGPFLVRNPLFCDSIIKKICQEKNINYQKPNEDAFEYLAYNTYLKNFYSKK